MRDLRYNKNFKLPDSCPGLSGSRDDAVTVNYFIVRVRKLIKKILIIGSLNGSVRVVYVIWGEKV